MIDKQKILERQRRWRAAHPNWQRDYRSRRPEHFKQYDRLRYLQGGLARKLLDFKKKAPTDDSTLSVENLVIKFGANPTCYLTGASIDLKDITSYSLDHILPVTKGGLSTLANCGLTTRAANQAKHKLSHQDFLDLCSQVVGHRSSTRDALKVYSKLS